MFRRVLLSAALLVCTFIIAGDLFASGPGGIVTSPNQSPEYIRTLNRQASTGVDAVYFNPAGTMKMKDGTHIGFSNQSTYKKYSFHDDSPLLPRDEYTSYVPSFIFPDFHLVHKKEKIAYMIGFDLVGGGGTGTHEDGIPFSDFIGMNYLVSQGIPSESRDVKSEFSGYYAAPGLTLGAAYAVNDVLSVAGQLRYVYVIGGTEAKVTPYIDGVAQPTEELDMTLSGDCFGFVLGANIAPTQELNIGIRYSYYTKMEMDQEINDGKDLYGNFASYDGTKVEKTFPQDITLGVSYHITPRWRVETSFIFYYNEGTDWSDEMGEGIENGWEAGVGFEYAVVPDKLLASIGYLYSKKGLPDELQYDVSNRIDAHSIGLGATYYFSPTLDVTFGYCYTWDNEVVNHNSMIGSTQKIQSYIHVFAVGFNKSF